MADVRVRSGRGVAVAACAGAVALAMLACAGTAMGQATVNPDAARRTKADAPSVPPMQVEPQWWNRGVFYQIFVRSFADSTTGPLANDGIGDFQGIIERLDYLNDGDPNTTTDLGITGLWLMPITASPTYHGYDTTDYYTINPQYGTNDDFKRFMDECRRRGIRVTIDLVLNHCADKHPWFQGAIEPGSEKHDWFIWRDSKPEWKGPWNQEVWHPVKLADGRTRYYYGIFSPRMPDVNYRNAAASTAMIDMTRWWLREMQVDGLRLDAIRHLIEDGQTQENTPATHEWLRSFRTAYKAENAEAFTVGEVWASTPEAAAYVGDQLDSTFEFDLAGKMLEAVNMGRATALASQMDRTLRWFPRHSFSTFLANHDQPRTMTQLTGGKGNAAPDFAKAKLAAGLLLTLPGVPFIYYGEEIGMTGPKPDEKIRTPMQWTNDAARAGFTKGKPWQAPNENTRQISVQAQDKNETSLLSTYRRFTHMRIASPALSIGEYTPVSTGSESVLAFLRHTKEQTMLVVANVSDKPVSAYGLSGRLPGDAIAAGTKDALAARERSMVRAPAMSALKVEENGAFDKYKPGASIPARTVWVIELGGEK